MEVKNNKPKDPVKVAAGKMGAIARKKKQGNTSIVKSFIAQQQAKAALRQAKQDKNNISQQ